MIEIISNSNLIDLLLAFLLFIFSKTVAAFRLNNFFRQIEINISEAYNFKLYLLGMFYNLFLPGGIGGDGYKIYLLNKKFDVKIKSLFWAVLLDRLSGMMVVFCMTIVFSYFISYPLSYKSFIWILIPLAVLGLYWFIRLINHVFLKTFTKTSLQSFIVQLSQVFAAYFILLAIGIENSRPEIAW